MTFVSFITSASAKEGMNCSWVHYNKQSAGYLWLISVITLFSQVSPRNYPPFVRYNITTMTDVSLRGHRITLFDPVPLYTTRTRLVLPMCAWILPKKQSYITNKFRMDLGHRRVAVSCPFNLC